MDKALEALDENLQSALSWLIVYARRNENYGENQDAVQHNAEMQKRYDLVLSALTQSSDREAALRALLAEAREATKMFPHISNRCTVDGCWKPDMSERRPIGTMLGPHEICALASLTTKIKAALDEQ